MSHPVTQSERGAFFWADVLRFVAATVVVLEHARDLLFLTKPELGGMSPPWQLFYFLTGFGSEAVVVFFVLSGFWITSAIERRIEQERFWTIYLIDRLSRLLVVVVPALIVGGMLDLAGIHWLHSQYAMGTSGAITLHGPLAPQLSPQVFLANLAFLQAIVFPPYGSNGPLWSLAYEFWYYIWFPALLLLFRYRRPTIGLTALGLAFFSLALAEGFAVWLMGSALFYLNRRFRQVPHRGPQAFLLIACSALVLLAALTASRLQMPYLGSPIVVGFSFAAFFGIILRTDPRPRKVARPLALYGANSSFSLYALHFPFIVLLAGLIPPAHRVAPDLRTLLVWAGVIVATIAWGWLFSHATERQTGALRAWLRSRLAGPATGSA